VSLSRYSPDVVRASTISESKKTSPELSLTPFLIHLQIVFFELIGPNYLSNSAYFADKGEINLIKSSE
jgi:hypothetical protein